MAEIKGGCLCGAVTYEISGEPIFVGHCACENCQKSTGTGHSSVAAFAASALKSKGELTTYVATGDSGQPTKYEFCPKCGSRLFTRPTVMPDAVIVAMGTMDDDGGIAPSMLIYNKRRRPWDHVDPAVPVFEGMPAPN